MRTALGEGEFDTAWAEGTALSLDEAITVASRMFVSRATVKIHLYHVYSKLDVANRTELAVLARDRFERG